MLSDEVLDKVVERLARRMEQANTYIIEQIGKSIKKIGTLSPTKAHELVQILKYGGDYDKIVRKIKEITKISIKDIHKIFQEVAKNDYEFAEQFYKYRNKKFIKWEENTTLRNMVESIEKQTAKDFINLTNTRVMAFGWQDKDGNITYKGLKRAYYDLLDEAVLNVSQGKESFESAMYRQLKEIGGGGIKVIFPSTYITKDKHGKKIIKNRVMRADSAIRMQMKDALRTLHNNMQENLGKDFDSNGVEISVHLNPAPDHELVQGRQFSNKQFDNFQNDKTATSYDGIEFLPEHEGRDRRSISQYNCYHYVFSIVLGVSKPAYTDEQLQQIIDNAHKKIKFDDKEYTMYEATQLQRKLELEIRKAKDEQIMGRSSGNDKLIMESQQRITQLTDKYRELSKISGLPTKVNRMRVSGYKRTKIETVKNTFEENFVYTNGIGQISHIHVENNNDIFDDYDEYTKEIIEDIEKDKIGLKHEEGTIIDRYGNTIEVIEGEEHGITLTTRQQKLLNNNIFTHNHQMGYTFSETDIFTYLQNNGYEVRANTDFGYYYSLKKGNIFNDKVGFMKQFIRDNPGNNQRLVEMFTNYQKRGIIPNVNLQGKQAQKILLKMKHKLMHKWFTDNVSKYGFIYKKEYY